MKILKVFLSLFIIFFFFVLPVAAREEETTSSAEIDKKVKELLEKNAADSGQAKETSPSASLKYYAWVGNLKKVETEVLVVNTDEGEKEAATDNKTTILQSEKGKSRKEVKVADLKVDNFIIAIGLKDGEKIKATRIISSPPETETEKKLVLGKVSEIEDEKIKLTNGEPQTLPVDGKTLIKINGSRKAGKLADIHLEDRLFAVVALEKDKVSTTLSIFTLPGKNAPQPTAGTEATPSATATPSASPKK